MPRGTNARLLLDEHISPKVAAALRKKGIDAYAVGDSQYAQVQGMPDQFLLERAAQEGRVLITYNYADFAVLHKEWVLKDRGHAGIGLVARGRIPSNNRGRQIKALLGFASEQPSYENQLIWIR